jgi:6-O-methylguanine DNA methyltransferase, DNA binding domain
LGGILPFGDRACPLAMRRNEHLQVAALTRWPSYAGSRRSSAQILAKQTATKEKDMQPREDAIVDIPENRLRFFGGAGKMLLPGPATVAALIKKVPAHKLITTNLLCQKLTQQFNVQGTCPVTTQKALQAVAHDPSNEVAYWRVIKVSGGLIAQFPGGAEGQAERLRKEGFTLDRKGKVTKVKNFRENLVRL